MHEGILILNEKEMNQEGGAGKNVIMLCNRPAKKLLQNFKSKNSDDNFDETIDEEPW